MSLGSTHTLDDDDDSHEQIVLDAELTEEGEGDTSADEETVQHGTSSEGEDVSVEELCFEDESSGVEMAAGSTSDDPIHVDGEPAGPRIQMRWSQGHPSSKPPLHKRGSRKRHRKKLRGKKAARVAAGLGSGVGDGWGSTTADDLGMAD